MSIAMILTFFGGVGLFLLGMRLMTDGLKVAAGDALRGMLARGTATTGRGILSGMLITAMVQSSTAVIIASIGFVNAGLMSLFQSVGVIIGSNIGTTATSWLVALVGLKVDVQSFALPAIALGMALRVSSRGTRRGAFGDALTGFGVFFLGIGVLRDTFVDVEDLFALDRLADGTIASLLVFVVIGIVLTVLMNASSAALAVTLTAASSGMIPLSAAAAMVIGANIGTTSTALFAVIGATSNAKRVALALTIINGVTGVAAFAILPLLLAVSTWVARSVGLDATPATVLAVFHTATKLTGTAIMWPITPWLVRGLQRLFATADIDEARPRFLDANVAGTPILALEALDKELARIGDIARRAAQGAISAEGSSHEWLEKDRATVDQLALAVGHFSNRVARSNDISEAIADAFANGVRVTQYYDDVLTRALEISRIHRTRQADIGDAALAAAIADFKRSASVLIDGADAGREDFRPKALRKAQKACEEAYQDLKRRLLFAGTVGTIPVRHMVARLDELSDIRRILDQVTKAALYTRKLHKVLRGRDRNGGDDDEAESESGPGADETRAAGGERNRSAHDDAPAAPESAGPGTGEATTHDEPTTRP
ncbi:MAG TPA: Na/Pi symporter [Rhodocyclaceae bacterium]|nr:Na/Pi symporter [Rhodocyclaceae bacterium]